MLDRYLVQLHRFMVFEMGLDCLQNDRAGSAAVQLRVYPKLSKIRCHSASGGSFPRSRGPADNHGGRRLRKQA